MMDWLLPLGAVLGFLVAGASWLRARRRRPSQDRMTTKAERDGHQREAREQLRGGTDPVVVARTLGDHGASAIDAIIALKAGGVAHHDAMVAVDACGHFPGFLQYQDDFWDCMAYGEGTEEVMTLLVDRDYAGAVDHCDRSRLSSIDVERVIEQYGGTIIAPPDNAYDEMNVVEDKTATDPTFAVRMPIWTAEEGRSDMTLELTIGWRQRAGETSHTVWIELDNIRVGSWD